MNNNKRLYLEQNKPRICFDSMQQELADLFDIIHPYQHWDDSHHTATNVKRIFRDKYNNDISNYVK